MKKYLIITCLNFYVIFFYSCKSHLQSIPKQLANPISIIDSIEAQTTTIYQVKASQITYVVDSLKIGGYIVRPKAITKPLPVIIYNRGGNRDFGTISYRELIYISYLAEQGYVVLASQYRGNSYSDGEDEFGGNDLNDVLALIDLAEQLPYANQDKIGVLGFSRGGLMAYLTSKATNKIDAIAVIGAPSDFFLLIENRPEMYTHVMLPLIGDTLSMKEEYIKRSPIYWFDEINEPTLILHGEEDERVNVLHAKNIIELMQENNQNIQYKIFEGGNHGLSSIDDEIVDKYILDWFKMHLSG